MRESLRIIIDVRIKDYMYEVWYKLIVKYKPECSCSHSHGKTPAMKSVLQYNYRGAWVEDIGHDIIHVRNLLYLYMENYLKVITNRQQRCLFKLLSTWPFVNRKPRRPFVNMEVRSFNDLLGSLSIQKSSC